LEFIMLTRIFALATALVLPVAASATEYQTVERPRQECWNEQVPVQAAYPNVAGTLVGGLAGGLLGNQVGGGNGRAIATAVGALTGAMVGNGMTSYTTGYQNVQRCRTVYDEVRVPVMPSPVQSWAPPMQTMPQPVQYLPQPLQTIAQPVQVIEQQPVYYVVPGAPRYYREQWDHGWHGRDHDRRYRD
jgi:uncharacterized protein YcfJ